ncbi:hypothetical protein [Paraburkholderia unamae]|uniref:Uncharacterized protein n=1 Tax=Paraburkholderia unamae TaxID=219649 RepID=A0ABX5KTL4_9BURK|nr:hypothetical protein [Paraburkholderia unamae]PVX84356.1 hypothetical protein C7402_105197 [Paraburkholderia unamae]
MLNELGTLLISVVILGVLIWAAMLPGVYRTLMIAGNVMWAFMSFIVPLAGAAIWFHDGAVIHAALVLLVVMPLMAWPYVLFGWPRLKLALSGQPIA